MCADLFIGEDNKERPAEPLVLEQVKELSPCFAQPKAVRGVEDEEEAF